jgi:hypothetical protein
LDSGEQDRLHVLESRFDLNDRRVWFGRAKLLPDLMLLRGIGYERRIMLQDIVEVRWAADALPSPDQVVVNIPAGDGQSSAEPEVGQ